LLPIEIDGTDVVEDHQVELAETRGVGHQFDGDDLPAGDREGEDDTRWSARWYRSG
jgi:hypothetical protein